MAVMMVMTMTSCAAQLFCIVVLIYLCKDSGSALVAPGSRMPHARGVDGSQRFCESDFGLSTDGKGDSLPPRLHQYVDALSSQPDARSKTLALVRLGDTYAMEGGFSIPARLARLAQKVPGCASEVMMAAGISKVGDVEVVEIRGASDSRVSRGIVALLCRSLSGEGVERVLSLDPGFVAGEVGLPAGMTSSRINGVANALAVVQAQLREARLGVAREGSQVAEKAVSRLAMLGDDSKRDDGSDERTEAAWGKKKSSSPSSAAVRWPNASQEVAVLLSGGVDSSVALRLLLEEGHRVRAFYLKIWLEDELSHLNECPWEEDLEFAKSVCSQAGVPLEVLSLQREYWREVVGYTVAEAAAGRTPNPDIMCNTRVKFGMFYELAGKYFKMVASGHYARLDRDEETGEVSMHMGPDAIKDQTYFLSALSQEQLSKAAFPLGRFTKAEVRELAQRYELPTKNRKDSQGVCFLGKIKFDDFLRHHLGENPGPCINALTGEEVGRHKGLWFHTIGQRKGIGPVLNPKLIHLGPWYVSGKDPERNCLYVTNECSGRVSSFPVEDIRWNTASGEAPMSVFSLQSELKVKTRHGPTVLACSLEEGRDSSCATCRILEKYDSGLAPGQFAAFYLNGRCLGSGVISL